MVAEIFDVFTWMLTYDQAWLMTLSVFAILLLIHIYYFKSFKRTIPFAFALGTTFYLLIDARLVFIIPYFLVWKLRGWKQVVAAVIAPFICIDGLILVAFAFFKNKSWLKRGILVYGVIYLLWAQALLFPTPAFHLVRNISGQGYEHNYEHLHWLQYVVMLYNSMWGLWGALVGFAAVLAAAWLMKRGDKLTILYCVAWTAYAIYRPYLLGDLWRYFMPMLFIASGIFGVKDERRTTHNIGR